MVEGDVQTSIVCPICGPSANLSFFSPISRSCSRAVPADSKQSPSYLILLPPLWSLCFINAFAFFCQPTPIYCLSSSVVVGKLEPMENGILASPEGREEEMFLAFWEYRALEWCSDKEKSLASDVRFRRAGIRECEVPPMCPFSSSLFTFSQCVYAYEKNSTFSQAHCLLFHYT